MSQPSPLPRQGLQLRVSATILDAAAHVLAERGANASMSDVSRAAGVARATVYRYFPNRRALLDELSAAALDDAGSRLSSAALDDVVPEEGIVRVVRALVGVGDAFVVLVRERVRADSAEFDRRIGRPLQRVLERAQADGDVREDVPTAWLMEVLIALIVSVPQAVPARGLDDTIAAITSLFLDGARGRGSGR